MSDLTAKDMKAVYRSGLLAYSKNLVKLLLGKSVASRRYETLGVIGIMQSKSLGW